MKRDELKCELKKLHCFRNWQTHNVINENGTGIAKTILEFKQVVEEAFTRLDDVESDVGFISLLMLSYVYFLENNLDEGLSCLNLFELKFINDSEPEFKHIFFASKAHFFFEMNDFPSTERYVALVKMMEPIDSLKFLIAEATLTKGFGLPGLYASIELGKRCVKQKPMNYEYHRFLGSLYGKIRRAESNYHQPTFKEMKHLKTAYHLNPNDLGCALTLARSYRDLGMSLHNSEKTGVYRKAVDTCLDILNTLRDGNEHEFNESKLNYLPEILFIMIKSNCDYDYLELYPLVLKTLQLRKSSVKHNHYLRLYFLKVKKFDQGLECFESSSVFLPYLMGVTLYLKYTQNPEVDLNNFIESRNDFQGSNRATFFYSVSEFYLFVKKDLMAASNFFLRGVNNLEKASISSTSVTKKPVKFLPILCKSVLVNKSLFDSEFYENLITHLKNNCSQRDVENASPFNNYKLLFD